MNDRPISSGEGRSQIAELLVRHRGIGMSARPAHLSCPASDQEAVGLRHDDHRMACLVTAARGVSQISVEARSSRLRVTRVTERLCVPC